MEKNGVAPLCCRQRPATISGSRYTQTTEQCAGGARQSVAAALTGGKKKPKGGSSSSPPPSVVGTDSRPVFRSRHLIIAIKKAQRSGAKQKSCRVVRRFLRAEATTFASKSRTIKVKRKNFAHHLRASRLSRRQRQKHLLLLLLVRKKEKFSRPGF